VSRTCPECQTQYDDEILHCPEDGLDLSSVEPDDELIGRSIGSYRVVKALGKGGMGAVYMAEHPVIGSRVAIKFLHPQYATDKKIVDRFFNEARAVNVIGHDNILKILDLNVTDDDRHYFIMEFLHGKSLQDLVKPDASIPLEVAGPILTQICEALQAAHDHKIVHRDLKPDNVYLIVHKGKKNFVKVVDFGIAKLTDEQGQSTGKTQTGMVMGTPAYMSPEQAGGMTTRIDARSDIYSLGCMMYQMACGRLPFPGSSFGEVLIGHLQLPPPSLRELNPEIPEAYEAVIMKCLEKKQEARYQSMKQVHDALLGVMEELGISRELPVANAAEMAAAFSGTKTKTSPPSASGWTPARPSSRPGQKRPSGPGQAGRATPQAQQATYQLAPPPRSRTGLIAGLGFAGLAAAVGVIFYVVQQQGEENRKAAERAAHIAAERVAQEAREAARKAEETAKTLQNEKVFLSVVSEPMGALAEVTWKDGAKAAATPFDLSVPKNAKVHFAFSKRDYFAYATDVIADAPQVVKGTLQGGPRSAQSQRLVRSRDGESGKGARRAATPDSKNPDDTIPVEF
jgi:serine/threonine protein kinase